MFIHVHTLSMTIIIILCQKYYIIIIYGSAEFSSFLIYFLEKGRGRKQMYVASYGRLVTAIYWGRGSFIDARFN